MGRLLAPYGVKGWIKVQPYTASPATLLEYDRWWLAPRQDPDAWKAFDVVSARLHGNTVLAELSGLVDRESVRPWRGASLGVPRQALPALAEGEIYWSDLIGMVAVNRTGEVLGKVTGLLETGAHPVLRIAGESGAEQLIPLVPAHIDAIEPQARRIVVDWQADY